MIFAELVTGPVALTNAVGYRKIMLASMELAKSNVRLSSNIQERAMFIIRKGFSKDFNEADLNT